MATATARQLGGFEGWARAPGVSCDARGVHGVRARLVMLERILEGLVRLPGNQRVGLDSFIGLVPVVGDLFSAGIGAYLVWEARNAGLSRWACARMLGRVGFDAALGAIPVAGDMFDFFYRSNSRNLKRILAHLEKLEKRYPEAGVIEGVRL